ncbi:MAG: hypothetical protein JST04_10095 [Bdellovibrionales bacterium]|nr:hypothetical protein [Bdellovibrionales bacterium]
MRGASCGAMPRFARSISLAVLTLALAGAAPSVRAEPSEVDAKLAALTTAVEAPLVQRCLNQFVLWRRLGNTCTRALDSLVLPVAEAKAALASEEARLRQLACPSIADYGCTPKEIAYREAAERVAHAAWNLRLTEDEALEDRHEGEWWDRWFVKDNRLSAVWAGDFVAKAKADYAEALKFIKTP